MPAISWGIAANPNRGRSRQHSLPSMVRNSTGGWQGSNADPCDHEEAARFAKWAARFPQPPLPFTPSFTPSLLSVSLRPLCRCRFLLLLLDHEQWLVLNRDMLELRCWSGMHPTRKTIPNGAKIFNDEARPPAQWCSPMILQINNNPIRL